MAIAIRIEDLGIGGLGDGETCTERSRSMGRWGDGEMGETRRINPAFPVITHHSSLITHHSSLINFNKDN
ncbi:hypothetical protein VF12_36480, partial [Nostoc linckia z15]